MAASEKIRVTELNYHPVAPTAAEIAAGFTDNEAFEWLEVKNIHSQPVNLAGYQFTDGVEFTFPSMVLQPGESTVVVANQNAFRFRYGFGPRIAGEFSDGLLNNNGEQLIFTTGGGQPVINFIYDDLWFPATDGGGQSLVIINPADALDVEPISGQSQAWNNSANWRPSTNPLGSPGIDDPAARQCPTCHTDERQRHVAVLVGSEPLMDRCQQQRKRVQDRAPHRHGRRLERSRESGSGHTDIRRHERPAGDAILLPAALVQRGGRLGRHRSGERDHAGAADPGRAVEPHGQFNVPRASRPRLDR